MIVRGGKQLEGLKGVSQSEHSHDGNDEVVGKEVCTSSNDVIGDDAHNSNKIPNDLEKFPQDLTYHLYHSPKEWLRLNLTNNLGSF